MQTRLTSLRRLSRQMMTSAHARQPSGRSGAPVCVTAAKLSPLVAPVLGLCPPADVHEAHHLQVAVGTFVRLSSRKPMQLMH